MDETIVHELAHALLTPLEDLIEDTLGALGLEARMQAEKRKKAVVEPTVERIARTLIAQDRGDLPDETRWAA